MLQQLWYSFFPPKIPKEYETILLQHSSYYAHLNPSLKKLFLKRLSILIHSLHFVSEKNIQVTQEMKILIGSAFIQITFGLKKYLLYNFKTIFIAPRKYTYKGMNQLIAGDVNPRKKLISLSWPSVIKGFEIEDDAVNIALHEISHSIDFENHIYPVFDPIHWNNWLKEGQKELLEIQNNEDPFLGKYAGQNMKELFARSIEFFFEQPLEFKTQRPHLFLLIQQLLQQNPLNKNHPIF